MIVRKTNKTETLFTFDFGDVPFEMDSRQTSYHLWMDTTENVTTKMTQA